MRDPQLHEAILEALKPLHETDKITLQWIPDGDVQVSFRKGHRSETVRISAQSYIFQAPEIRERTIQYSLAAAYRSLLTSIPQPGPGAAWGEPLRRRPE